MLSFAKLDVLSPEEVQSIKQKARIQILKNGKYFLKMDVIICLIYLNGLKDKKEGAYLLI
jgi:hypothetical protein